MPITLEVSLLSPQFGHGYHKLRSRHTGKNAKAHMPFHLPRNNLVGYELGSHGLQLRAGQLSGR